MFLFWFKISSQKFQIAALNLYIICVVLQKIPNPSSS